MTHRAEPPEASGSELAAGIGVMFAAVMMIMTGIFQVFQGLAAVMSDEFFVTVPNYVVTIDVTTWGWIHLIMGVLIRSVVSTSSPGAGRRRSSLWSWR
jgi:uncharacterized membrane protein